MSVEIGIRVRELIELYCILLTIKPELSLIDVLDGDKQVGVKRCCVLRMVHLIQLRDGV